MCYSIIVPKERIKYLHMNRRIKQMIINDILLQELIDDIVKRKRMHNTKETDKSKQIIKKIKKLIKLLTSKQKHDNI